MRKKTASPLRLTRETLHRLEEGHLVAAQGAFCGTAVSCGFNCASMAYTACNSCCASDCGCGGGGGGGGGFEEEHV